MRFTEIIDDACRRWADRTAFRVPGHAETWSYERVRLESNAIAAALQARGLARGSAVALLSANSPEGFIAQLGIIKSGAAYVPLNAKSAVRDWGALTRGAGASALIFDVKMADQADALLDKNAALTRCFTLGERPGYTTLSDLIETHFGEPVERVIDDREDPCWIGSSGGTTGSPKAIAIPHRAMLTQTLALNAHMPDMFPVQLVSAPLTHSAGVLTFPVMLQGGETIVMDGARPTQILHAIEEYGVTRLFMPPTAIYAMLAAETVQQHDYSSLRYFLYGAAPMSPAKLREALSVFGPVMSQFYGQAEQATICTWLSPHEVETAARSEEFAHRLSSCGRPSAVASVRILDEDGEPVATGEIGEIAVKSDLCFLGYMNAPEETEKLRAKDGYMRTGDMGRIDSDGFVYISGRSREMILTGGFNVFPSEVERVLSTHPSVQDCAVIGLPDAYWGEAVTAVIELKPGMSEATKELLALCRDQLGPVLTPKHVFYGTLPRSAVGKVLKTRLHERYAIDSASAGA